MDPKSKLNELAQRRGEQLPVYLLNPTSDGFEASCSFIGITRGGTGPSKQKAKAEAARAVLNCVEETRSNPATYFIFLCPDDRSLQDGSLTVKVRLYNSEHWHLSDLVGAYLSFYTLNDRFVPLTVPADKMLSPMVDEIAYELKRTILEDRFDDGRTVNVRILNVKSLEERRLELESMLRACT